MKKFWQQHPALLYGLSALVGTYAALNWTALLLVPLIFLLIKNDWIRSLLAMLIIVSIFCFVKTQYQYPQMAAEGISGMAYIKISSLTSSSTHFGKRWIYQGVIKKFIDNNNTLVAQNIACKISLPNTKEILRPPANQAYWVNGVLKETSPGNYSLAISKHNPWHSIENSWGLAEYRFQAKQYVSRYIRRHITNPSSAAFLAGIATGDFDDRLMAFELGRFGLQHIMAISGFHFAIVASILSFLLRFAIGQRKATLILMLLMSSYCLFLGFGPSIMRAWLMILISLGGFLVERRSYGLNSLGVAMLIVLLIDPLLCRSIGFQFSFITTAAILLLYPAADVWMQRFFTSRPLSQMIEMDSLNQHGYIILTALRKGLALTLAVNIVALPMMLAYFQKFPLLSLIYNLFFPFLVTLSMLLLICSLLTAPLPFVSDMFHAINNTYTQFTLNFAYNMPTSVDIMWRVSNIPAEALICYYCLVFAGGIYTKALLDKRREELQDRLLA